MLLLAFTNSLSQLCSVIAHLVKNFGENAEVLQRFDFIPTGSIISSLFLNTVQGSNRFFFSKKSCYSSKTTANSADNAGVLARSTDAPLSAKTSRPVAVLLTTPAIISPIFSGKKRS